MNILICHDEPGPLKAFFEGQKHVVEAFSEFEDGLEILRDADHLDCVIVFTPTVLLKSRIEAVRKFQPGIAFIVLMAVTPELESGLVVSALHHGADDALTAPYHFGVIEARAAALCRRVHMTREKAVTVGDLTLNEATRSVFAKGEALHLTGCQYEVFRTLFRASGATCTKEHLFDSLYGITGGEEVEIKIINVFVSHIRRKLRAAGVDPNYIGTSWGVGYYLAVPDGLDRYPSKIVEAA